MTLMERLQPDEWVLARVGPCYATTRRVLRCDAVRDGTERLIELSYNGVRSIKLVRPSNHRLMAGVG